MHSYQPNESDRLIGPASRGPLTITTGMFDVLNGNSPESVAKGLNPTTVYTVDGAITLGSGTNVIDKAGVCALTLAAPSNVATGTLMIFTSDSPNAHTITATGLISDGVTGGYKNLLTFGAFRGASVTLHAYAGKWQVISKNVVTVS